MNTPEQIKSKALEISIIIPVYNEREYLTLLESLEVNLTGFDVEKFYYLSRSCLVKDEKNLDKFDRVFGSSFEGLKFDEDVLEAEIPEEWVRKISERVMTPEEMAEI